MLDSSLLRDVVEDNRALLDVMVSRVMLCVVVSLVLTARLPENPELFLCLAVLEPVISHVHCLGTFVFCGFVCDADSG